MVGSKSRVILYTIGFKSDGNKSTKLLRMITWNNSNAELIMKQIEWCFFADVRPTCSYVFLSLL